MVEVASPRRSLVASGAGSPSQMIKLGAMVQPGIRPPTVQPRTLVVNPLP
jgi:hypothetical protein